jgi:nucleoside-diphosphate-sugar epimerase
MPSSSRYTIALTGALGLVGCGFTALALSLGHRVIALDIRPNDTDEQLLLGLGETTPQDIALRRVAIDAADDGQYTYIQCDLTDYQRTKQIVQKEGCDAVVHLAAVYAKKDAEGRYVSGPDQDVSNKPSSWPLAAHNSGVPDRHSKTNCRGRS